MEMGRIIAGLVVMAIITLAGLFLSGILGNPVCMSNDSMLAPCGVLIFQGLRETISRATSAEL